MINDSSAVKWFTGLLLCGLAGLLIYGCEDDPVGPTGPKDYLVYWFNSSHTEIYYGYHTVTGEIDTFALPYKGWRMAVSADGRLLYVSEGNDTSYVVDLATKATIATFPYKGDFGVSPDGKTISVNGDSLYLLRTSDYSLIYCDTSFYYSHYMSEHFSSDGHRFYYGVEEGDGFTLCIVKLDQGCEVERKHFPGHHLAEVLPSMDESKLFMTTLVSNFLWSFEVYDVASDAFIFQKYIYPGYLKIAATKDDRWVFFTNSDCMNCPPLPSGQRFGLYVYDVWKNQILKRIDPYLVQPPHDTLFWYWVSDMVVTPDNRWLIGKGNTNDMGFVAVDIQTLEIDRTVCVGPDGMYELTCQLKP